MSVKDYVVISSSEEGIDKLLKLKNHVLITYWDKNGESTMIGMDHYNFFKALNEYCIKRQENSSSKNE